MAVSMVEKDMDNVVRYQFATAIRERISLSVHLGVSKLRL